MKLQNPVGFITELFIHMKRQMLLLLHALFLCLTPGRAISYDFIFRHLSYMGRYSQLINARTPFKWKLLFLWGGGWRASV